MALNLLLANSLAQIVSHVSLLGLLLCNSSSMVGQRLMDYFAIGTAILRQVLSGLYIIVIPVCVTCD